jgi:hypothetical protein
MRTMMRHALNIDERIVGRTRDDVWRRASEDDSTRRRGDVVYYASTPTTSIPMAETPDPA